jgi:hypothetical protein
VQVHIFEGRSRSGEFLGYFEEFDHRSWGKEGSDASSISKLLMPKLGVKAIVR